MGPAGSLVSLQHPQPQPHLVGSRDRPGESSQHPGPRRPACTMLHPPRGSGRWAARVPGLWAIGVASARLVLATDRAGTSWSGLNSTDQTAAFPQLGQAPRQAQHQGSWDWEPRGHWELPKHQLGPGTEHPLGACKRSPARAISSWPGTPSQPGPSPLGLVQRALWHQQVGFSYSLESQRAPSSQRLCN